MRLLLSLLLVSSSAVAASFGEPVDLNAPGALSALHERNPEHYAKAEAILKLAEKRPKAELAPWIEATFDARDVHLIELWRVSNPPKVDVYFTLDHTRYTARVTPKLEPARFMPAK